MSDSKWPHIPGYRIERELGVGRMATVYLAVQGSLGRQVALKVMKAVLAADRDFAEHFLREARAAASLQHSAILPIYDAGHSGHHFYIAMEYVSGGSLRDRLRQGALETAEAVEVVRQIAGGLNFVHGKEFVYHGVKPENILFRDDGTAVLSDFGIARVIESGTRITATSLSVGIPHYMSPEQVRGQAVDSRSDLYALGVLFYEMLTGRVPFDAGDSFAVGLKHVNDPPPPLPQELARFQPVLDRLLAKDSVNRYQSGRELIEALNNCKSAPAPARSQAEPTQVAPTARSVAKTKVSSTPNPQSLSRTDSSGLAWVAAGALLAVMVGIGTWFFNDNESYPFPTNGSETLDLRGSSPDETHEEPVFQTSQISASRRIKINTDVLVVDLDANGGTLVDLRLKDYPVSVDRPDEPFTLMVEELPDLFVAQAGLLSGANPAPNHRSRWEFEQDYYELAPGQDRLEVPLTWRDESGLEVVATWIFHRGDYVVDLDIEVINRSGESWRGARYVQLQRAHPDFSDAGFASTNPERFSYNGAAVYNPEDALKKISWGDIESRPFEGTFDEGWAAMIQHYFLTAWIPPADQRHRYTTRHVTSERLPRYILAATSPQVEVPDGDSYRFSARLYAGPKLQNRLDEVAPGLRLTVDYRWFRILSQPLFWGLDNAHTVIGDWGWAIFAVAVVIRLMFSLFSWIRLRYSTNLQQRIQLIRNVNAEDPQQLDQALTDIYRRVRLNVLGGGIPILIQIPIFLSLHWVLIESVELRQAGFLWVPDLLRPDPYFILPILNGILIISTQRLVPTVGLSSLKRNIRVWLPIVFSLCFVWAAAGLVLYWIANAGVSLIQQWYTLRYIDRKIQRSTSGAT